MSVPLPLQTALSGDTILALRIESPFSEWATVQMARHPANDEHSLQQILVCWICGKRIKPEECQLDEQGLAVHPSCLNTRIALISATQP